MPDPATPSRHTANIRQKLTVADDEDAIDPNLGFYADVSGTLSFRARGEAALDAMPVLQGVLYPIDVAEVDFAGSTTTAAIWVLRHAVL